MISHTVLQVLLLLALAAYLVYILKWKRVEAPPEDVYVEA